MWMSVKEAAALLGLSESGVRKQVRAKRVRSRQLARGRRTLYEVWVDPEVVEEADQLQRARNRADLLTAEVQHVRDQLDRSDERLDELIEARRDNAALELRLETALAQADRADQVGSELATAREAIAAQDATIEELRRQLAQERARVSELTAMCVGKGVLRRLLDLVRPPRLRPSQS